MKTTDNNIAALNQELKVLRSELGGLLKAGKIREYNHVVPV